MSKPSILLCYPCSHHRRDLGDESPGGQTCGPDSGYWPDTASRFWEQLLSRDAAEICQATGAVHDGESRLRFKVLQDEWLVDASARQVVRQSGESDPEWDMELPFLILVHMATAVDVPIDMKMTKPNLLIPGLDLFKGLLELETLELKNCFETRAKRLSEVMQQLKAEALEQADNGYRVHIFPNIPVDYLFWDADEDFESELNILLESNCLQRLPVDGMSALVNQFTRRLLRLTQ